MSAAIHEHVHDLHDLPSVEFDLMGGDETTRGLSLEALLQAHRLAERAQEAQERAAEAQERERDHHRLMELRRDEEAQRQAAHDRAIEAARERAALDRATAEQQAALSQRAKAREQSGWLLVGLLLIALGGAGVRYRGAWLGLEVSSYSTPTPTPTVDARPREEIAP